MCDLLTMIPAVATVYHRILLLLTIVFTLIGVTHTMANFDLYLLHKQYLFMSPELIVSSQIHHIIIFSFLAT